MVYKEMLMVYFDIVILFFAINFVDAALSQLRFAITNPATLTVGFLFRPKTHKQNYLVWSLVLHLLEF